MHYLRYKCFKFGSGSYLCGSESLITWQVDEEECERGIFPVPTLHVFPGSRYDKKKSIKLNLEEKISRTNCP